MDYDRKTHLFERPGENCELAKRAIENLALPVKSADGLLYTLYDPISQSSTMVKISYDEFHQRTLIRTETTPNISLPENLLEILETQDFKKIV